METRKYKIPLIIGGLVLVVGLGAGGLYIAINNNANQSSQSTTTSLVYKNGTYTATGSYNSKGGLDELGVTLTLKDDVITNAVIEAKAVNRESIRYQQRFAEGINSVAVGKKIDQVYLSGRVSGSSETTIGFNDAVAKIKTQARY